MLVGAVVLGAALSPGAGSGVAGAWPGDPDGAYAACGVRAVDVTVGEPSAARAAATGPDGKVVVAGYAGDAGLVMRVGGGRDDTTFATAGRKLITFNGSVRFHAVAVTSGGAAIVAGERTTASSSESVVAKVKPSGSLETAFHSTGKVSFDAGGADRATAVAVLADGSVLVGGNAGGGGYVARFTAAGVPDTGWAGDGRRDGLDIDVRGLAARADGTVYVVGGSDASPADWRVVRLGTDGQNDSGFGGASGVTLDLGGDDVATAVDLGSGGTVVVTGYGVGAAGHGKSVIRRFLSDGSNDGAFTATPTSFGTRDTPVALDVSGDGRVLVAGNSKVGTDNDLVLWRVLADGSDDDDFGIGGATVADVGRRSAAAGLAVGGDGRPLVVGRVWRSGQERVGLFRHQADGSSAVLPTQGVVVDGHGKLYGWRAGCSVSPGGFRGGPSWPANDYARGVAVVPGNAGFVLDLYGGVHGFAFGDGPTSPPTVAGAPYWPGWDIARGIAVVPEGTGGYVLDGFGGVHRFRVGSGPLPPSLSGTPYWSGFDVARGIALMPDGGGGYVVDATGRIYRFGGAPAVNAGYATWPGQDIARGITLSADGSGGWVVDLFGGLHRFGTGGDPLPPSPAGGPYWGSPSARGVAALPA